MSYCVCSLSTNSLRFCPLIIIILLLITLLYTKKKIKKIKIKINGKVKIIEENLKIQKNDKIEIVHFIGGG